MGLIKYLIKLGENKRLKNTVSNNKKICASCGSVITEEEGRTKQFGLHYHRSCWKKEKRAALA